MSSAKINQWIEKEFVKNLGSIIIDGTDRGGWLAFGVYQIIPVGSRFQVLHYDNHQGDFSTKRSAISYCVADKLNQQALAKNIKILDEKKQQLDADVGFCRDQIQNAKNIDFKEMVLTKIQTKEATKKVVVAELEKCVNSAKYLQLRGFSNEIARLGRN